MTLLTPPHSRSDKENRRAAHSMSARVAWSQINEYHSATSPVCKKKPAASASKELPVRSILKQTSYPILPLLFSENERQVTPEPGDPLSDLHYLDRPVNKILAECSTLPDLIEAYSVLTARLRVAVQETTDSNCSWPLFQPIRKRRLAFVDSVIRDLGRALVDPVEGDDQLGCPEPEPPSALPSPEKSPRKRRCGMDEEQVKYARDLVTVSHAVIKFLGLVFALPAVYGLFDDQDLGSMVTQALAIPLTPELPTPNSRKTCALVIWLLQTQRLPADVLAPAKDRITYALRRAVEGELGKEGKKGSVSDGMKAIHNLSVHEPSIFVPAFTELLPSLLDNLLAPRLALRAQACHALGGLALGASQIPLSHTHTRLSEIVNAVLTYTSSSPASPPRTPSAGKSDSMLIKTLRTTLGTHDPSCAAQGPVWALCTLAALIVLLGPALVTSIKLTNAVKALLALSVRHRKSSVRALACVVWRPLAWAYFRPPLPRKSDEEEDEVEERAWKDERMTKPAAWTPAEDMRRVDFWKVVTTMVDMGAGVGTIGALLAHKSDDVRSVSRAITLLEAMVKRGGNMCHDAVQTLCQLVSAAGPGAKADEEGDSDWDWTKLLPSGLFSADPGLLTIDFISLSEEVRQVLKQTATVADVRALSAAELWMTGVMDGLIKVWRIALTQVCLSWDAELPPELVQSWNGLLKAALRGLQGSTDDNDDEDSQDEDLVQKLAELTVSLMQDILGDPKVQLVPSADEPTPSPTGPEVDLAPHTRSNAAMKLAVVRSLWAQAHTVLPAQALAGSPSETLLTWLMKKETELVRETDTPHDARTQWANLCAEVIVRTGAAGCSSSLSLLRMFWGTPGASQRSAWNWTTEVRSRVWRAFMERWRTLAKGWEEAPVLLSVPFADKNGWEMGSEDLDAWDATLQVCLARVLDDGADAARVLDHLAGTIASTHIPTGASALRAAELMLGHLETPPDAPALLGFANDTLVSTYPPEPQNKVASMWLIRTATRVVDTCPVNKLCEVVGSVQEGLCVWIADQYRVFTAEEYAFDVVPLYQTALICLQSLGSSIDVLKALGPLLEAGFTGREDKPQAVVDAFQDYWDLTFAKDSVPKGGWPSTVITCLKACVRDVIMESTSLPAETGDISVTEKIKVPMLEPAFTWGSSSTIAADDDNASDVTMTSQDSNPSVAAAQTKDVEMPSTPKAAALSVSSPQRPSKTATIRRTPFAQPTKLDYNFVMGTTSPSVSSPSRLPPSPLRSPRKTTDGACSSDKENTPPKPAALPSLLDRIAMAASSPGTPKLGKRRASNVPTDSPPKKKSRGGRVARKSNDDGGGGGDHCVDTDNDSEAEREEVRKSLLSPVTPSSAAQRHPQHAAALTAFATHKRKRKSVFMDAVVITKPRSAQTLRKTHSVSLHTMGIMPTTRTTHEERVSLTSDEKTIVSPPPLPPLSLSSSSSSSSSSGPVAHQNMRRTKSLSTFMSGADDSMAAELEHSDGAVAPSCESSDDDPHHLGQVTPHHIFSPAPRRMSLESRFFSIHE
ncbi:hypothetical protein F5888DRAFT_1620590 [Russula emetica]|nr:hypothetical protein F5888DRAFT_1620590 [Russula emetica]